MKSRLYGIGLCLIIALPAFYLGKLFPLIGGPVFAILLGMIVTGFYKNKEKTQTGINYVSKMILQYAVILLGFGMNLTDVLKTGTESLPIIIMTISTSLIISYLLFKIMKMPTNISILVGVGSSICGGSAIAATSPVIEANDEEIAQSISVIFIFNILAALIFPALGTMLQLSNHGFSIFAGSAVNDTSSVTATASSWDGMYQSHTLEGATIVKLTRTLAIIPITVCLALWRGRKSKDGRILEKLKAAFPTFIIFFILASIMTSVFSLPSAVTMPIKELSKFFIIMAMAAIGLNTNLIKLVKTGIKPIVMGFCCWVGITGVCLFMQSLLGLW